MITFIIPLKNKEVALSWNKTLILLQNTLRSILNQTNNNFKVIVVSGQSIPSKIIDNKIDYLTTNKTYDHDLTVEEKRIDKGEKLIIGYNKALTYNPDYVMVVDADDFICNTLVDYIETNSKDTIGYCLNCGYVYDGNEMFYCKSDLARFCGSTLVVKPELFKHTFVDNIYIHFQNNHINGVPLLDVPFPSVIYNKGHGENFYPYVSLYGTGYSCNISQEVRDAFLFNTI